MAQSREYMRIYMSRRYHEKRVEMFAALGGRCAVCGSKDELQIDHIDWRTKSIGEERMSFVGQERRDAELAKCQLLCRTHHLEKSRKDLSEIRRAREAQRRAAIF